MPAATVIGMGDPVYLAPFTPASSHAEYFFELKQLLITAGWKIVESSDGTTYNDSGDEIGSSADWNANAWIRVRRPDSNAEFTLQHLTGGTDWRVKYSTDQFGGGTPGATQTPSAADEVVLLGGGTDASPTGEDWTGARTAAGYTFVAAADKVSPFGFWACGFHSDNANAPNHAWAYDPVIGAPSQDADPYVHLIGDAATTYQRAALQSGADQPDAWYEKGLAGEAFEGVRALQYNDGAARNIPGSLDPNAHSGRSDLLPVPWSRRTGDTTHEVFKGYSSLFLWRGDETALLPRVLGEERADRHWLVLADLVAPWQDLQVQAAGEVAVDVWYAGTSALVLRNVAPTAGGDLAATNEAARFTPITGQLVALGDHAAQGILIWGSFGAAPYFSFVVYADGAFQPMFTDHSTLASDGSFSILPLGGWPEAPQLSFGGYVEAQGS